MVQELTADIFFLGLSHSLSSLWRTPLLLGQMTRLVWVVFIVHSEAACLVLSALGPQHRGMWFLSSYRLLPNWNDVAELYCVSRGMCGQIELLEMCFGKEDLTWVFLPDYKEPASSSKEFEAAIMKGELCWRCWTFIWGGLLGIMANPAGTVASIYSCIHGLRHFFSHATCGLHYPLWSWSLSLAGVSGWGLLCYLDIAILFCKLLFQIPRLK